MGQDANEKKRKEWKAKTKIGFVSDKTEVPDIVEDENDGLIDQAEVDRLMYELDDPESHHYKTGTETGRSSSIHTNYSGTTTRCHHTHPPLPIVVGDKTYKVYGGSCTNPVVKDMDVFVGLTDMMARTYRQFPWHKGVEFMYPIQDMGVPSHLKEFQNMIAYLKEQVLAGKKVFIGCIGGHGRTGLVLAALVKSIANETDAVTYVRDHYCHRAVESSKQIRWLHDNFGIKTVTGSKAKSKQRDFWGSESSTRHETKTSNTYVPPPQLMAKISKTNTIVVPVNTPGHVHGKNAYKKA